MMINEYTDAKNDNNADNDDNNPNKDGISF